jgi:hypothetical protein
MGVIRDVLHETLLPRLNGVKSGGGGFVARCPAHEDHAPSLSITPGTSQPIVLMCHAGCQTEDILAAIGLTWADISQPQEERDSDEEWTPAGPASHVYDYRNEAGKLLYQVLRVPQPGGSKTFRQRVPDPMQKSGWRWKLGDTRRVLYRLPELIAAIDGGETVYCVEGEKDVENLARISVTATCNSGGAGKWLDEYADLFVDVHVRIVADRDDPGRRHARTVAASLAEVAGSVTIVEPVAGKDVSDHLAAGKTLDELVVTWMSERTPKQFLAPDLHEFLSQEDPETSWVIPGLLERGDRLIWTGTEGLGKSLTVRQIAVAAAAGLHPFRNQAITPQTVLYVDCENSERQGRKHFRNLERIAGVKNHRVPNDRMFLIHRPQGIDLSRTEDAAWLLERVTAHKPDLLVCGPFYRLHSADSEEEKGARRVVQALDAARVEVDCALIVEHHAPHGSNGVRNLRPFGSSLLLRWPEMGMGIAPATEDFPCKNVLVKPWRGSRDERDWPHALRWGTDPTDWPWVVDDDWKNGHS